MQYFVIAADGNRYGPADFNMLRQWVTENRVTPGTVLEDVATGQRVQATSIGGLFPAPQVATYMPMGDIPGTYAQPPSAVQYPRAYYDDSSANITWAFVCFGVGAAICVLSPITCTIGLVQANKALAKGNPSAKAAQILNLILLILGVLVWAFYAVMIAVGVSGGFD